MNKKGFTQTLQRTLHSFRSFKVSILLFINKKFNSLNNSSIANAELRGARLVRGFTLLELIIVIGIIAILGTVAIIVLNPAQLFAQARDTTRISDLSSLNKAISLYLTDVSSPTLAGGAAFTCTSNWGTSRVAGTPTKLFTTLLVSGTSHAGAFGVDGTGWVAVPLSTIVDGGSPIAALPRDPTNDDTYNYQYACGGTDNLFFELDAKMESTKYKNAGSLDKESTDGGGNINAYEVGTVLTL